VKGQDSQGKKIIKTTTETTNDGNSYYEIINDLWSGGNPKYIYTKTVSYPVPDTSQRFDNTGEEYEDQSTTTTGGYQPGDNILVRRRH
jgi:wyosine [tRNA(Phe)-imidazoG37] synthetase (radical SAM superfamily)